jgi:hypothetical protein
MQTHLCHNCSNDTVTRNRWPPFHKAFRNQMAWTSDKLVREEPRQRWSQLWPVQSAKPHEAEPHASRGHRARDDHWALWPVGELEKQCLLGWKQTPSTAQSCSLQPSTRHWKWLLAASCQGVGDFTGTLERYAGQKWSRNVRHSDIHVWIRMRQGKMFQ